MLYPLRIILDFIFPPTIHERVLRQVTPLRFENFYQPHTHHSITCLSSYHIPTIQAAIAACKFEHNFYAAKLLGVLVATHLKTLPTKKTLIIPIPLSLKREREWGFNQVARVLTYIKTSNYNATIHAHILTRSRHTKPQTSLNRIMREKNVEQAFSCTPKYIHLLSQYERIILCDDVCTTGSTLMAAREVLLPHLPSTTEVSLLAWAH
ncbi:MAG: hypothetical protein V4606_00420 [Patescibacteria group bacterium]